jgi:plasmid stabilization system protein ParE
MELGAPGGRGAPPQVFQVKRLELRLEARAEFLDAIRWYEAERTGLGARFEGEVDRVLTRIQASPQQFPEIEPGYRRAFLRGFPYAVFFAASTDQTVVLAVLHFHRNPETWKSRR